MFIYLDHCLSENKLFLQTTVSTYFCIIFSGLGAAMTESACWDRNCTDFKAYTFYYVTLYRKCLSVPYINQNVLTLYGDCISENEHIFLLQLYMWMIPWVTTFNMEQINSINGESSIHLKLKRLS